MATATTFTFTNFNRVPKPWAGGPILLPDKVSVQVGYAAAANIAPKPFSALDAANSAAGIYSVQNVAAAAAAQGAAKVVAESSSVVESSVSTTVQTPSLQKTELKRELSKTVEVQESTQMCSTLEFSRDVAVEAPAAAEVAEAALPAAVPLVKADPEPKVEAALVAEASPVVEAVSVVKAEPVPVVSATTAASAVEAAAQVSEAAAIPEPKPATESAAPAAAPAPAPVPVVTAPPKMPSIPKGPRKPTLGSAGSAKMQQPIFSGKVPICAVSGKEIRGPFILALGKTFSPDSFICANNQCCANLQNCGFVEEGDQLFCEVCYEAHFAPKCAKCNLSIKHDCVNAMGQTFHPECFVCFHTKKPIGTGGFHIEDGNVYSTEAWNELFTTKCYGCEFPIEPSDRWVEALGQNWHAECFNCAVCGVNLEGQSFYAKGGRPYCKKHASSGFR